MNLIKTAFISTIAALTLTAPLTAAAAPSFRVGGTAYNPETGNAARSSAGYHSPTGSRYGRRSSYDASTQTYQENTRAYNPSTGQGFTSNTTATKGSGVNSSINTLNNGSYECSISQDLPAHCVETSY